MPLREALESSDEQTVVRCLNELLAQETTASEARLLGPVANKVRKNASFKEASPLAAALLQKWKPLLLEATRSNASSDNSDDSSANKSTSSGFSSRRRDTASSSDKRPDRSDPDTGMKQPVDPIRGKSVELLTNALKADNPDNDVAFSVAVSIEEAIYDLHSRTASSEYRSKVRSKYLNLKNNAVLRTALLSAAIMPPHFVRMSAAEMASPEVREADAKAAAQALLETQAAVDGEAETDQFKCGRCGKRKCKYYQLQTRSADEPMTTFVTCVNCGNRWKFS